MLFNLLRFKERLFLLIFSFCFFINFSQTHRIEGEVYDEYLEPFIGALIKASNGKTTTSDIDGKFVLDIELPMKVSISYIGYSTEEIEITDSEDHVNIILKENSGLDQIVLSASRQPERLFESHGSVERISLNDIRKTASLSFYESLENLKNVDVKTNSLLLKSVNTRGFSPIENTRIVQFIDGVDNVFPAATISTGNMTGLVDMDVENVEILPGASSALYGANAFNGVILINSKSPFDYEGISAKLQAGITNQDSGNNAFYNPSIRFAYKFDDYFAAKASFNLFSGTEWDDNDYRNVKDGKITSGSREDEHYDGVNVYGDEFVFNPKAVVFNQYLVDLFSGNQAAAQQKLQLISIINDEGVTRTGYEEKYFTENDINNVKFNSSIYYRPFGNEKLQIGWTSRFTTSKSLFTFGSSKFAIENGKFGQHILEVKGDKFFVRGYMTNVNFGDSYSLQILPNILDETYNPTLNWVGEYVGLLVQGKSSQEARLFANRNRFSPNSSEFNRQINELKNKPILEGGAKLIDNSKIYQGEGNFKLDNYIDIVDVQIGGSYRKYYLDQPGILNNDKPINSYEYGVYTQIRKKLIDDRLDIIGSIRYDKSKNFDGQFSPKISFSYTLGEDKNHLFRLSTQTAFRTPTIQQQYVSLYRGNNHYIVGNTLDNINNSLEAQINYNGISTPINEDFLINNAGFTKASFDNYYNSLVSDINSGDNFSGIANKFKANFNKLKTSTIQLELKPESLTTLELGYRSIINISSTNTLEIDFNGYFNQYNDFIHYESLYIPGETTSLYGIQANVQHENSTFLLNNQNPTPKDIVANPYTLAILSIIGGNRTLIDIPQNISQSINSYGLGISLGTKFLNNYKLRFNYSWNDFDYDENSNFIPDFNTSKHSVKLMIGNNRIFKNLGFNIASRWYSEYDWNSDFADGIIDARTVIDGQLTYRVPVMKSKFKLGANNLLGKPFFDNLGNGQTGSIYYLSWIIND